MIERKTISFSKFKPVARDHGCGYSYVNPRDGRKVSPGSDRWMRTKGHLAAVAIAVGVTEFQVWGGLGPRRWRRTVTVTEAEAERYFEDALASGNFMLKGTFEQAKAGRERRRKLTTCAKL